MRGPASSISMLLLLHALCCNHLIFKSSPPLTHSHSCPSPPDLFHPLCHERKRRIRSPEQEERNTFCSTNIYKHIILADSACRRERMFHLLLYTMFHYTRLLSLPDPDCETDNNNTRRSNESRSPPFTYAKVYIICEHLSQRHSCLKYVYRLPFFLHLFFFFLFDCTSCSPYSIFEHFYCTLNHSKCSVREEQQLPEKLHAMQNLLTSRASDSVLEISLSPLSFPALPFSPNSMTLICYPERVSESRNKEEKT
jgi:hypothetical protein